MDNYDQFNEQQPQHGSDDHLDNRLYRQETAQVPTFNQDPQINTNQVTQQFQTLQDYQAEDWQTNQQVNDSAYQTTEPTDLVNSGDQYIDVTVPKRSKRANSPEWLSDIPDEVLRLVKQVFSSRPMDAFATKLSWATIGICYLVGVLVVALTWASLSARVVTNFMQVISQAVSTTTAKTFTSAFLYGLLQQVIASVVTLLLIFLLTFALRSRKASLKRYIQTVVVAGVPTTIICVIGIIVGLLSPHLGLALGVAACFQYYIYLYAGMQKCHPTHKTSPFWFYFVVLFVNTLVMSQAISFVGSAVIKSLLNIG